MRRSVSVVCFALIGQLLAHQAAFADRSKYNVPPGALGFAGYGLDGNGSQSAPTRYTGSADIKEVIKKGPLEDKGLYELTVLKCDLHPLTFPGNDLDNFGQSLSKIFVDPVITATGVLTISTKEISTNEAPPTSSIITVIPFEDRLSSNNNTRELRNNECHQSFLINGHNSLFLGVSYAESVSEQPSELMDVIAGLSGIAKPLMNVVPGGAAAGPVLDAINGLNSPYSTLLAAFSRARSSPVYIPIQVGTYHVTTSSADVDISVKPIRSVRSDAELEIKQAFEQEIVSLRHELADKHDCLAKAGDMLDPENYSRADVVYALAKATIASGMSLQTMEACLTRDYGPEVMKDPSWQSVFGQQPEFTEDDFPARYDATTAFNRFRADSLIADLNRYLAKKPGDTPPNLSDYNARDGIKFSDLTGSLGSVSSITSFDELADALGRLKFTSFGCAFNPKDEAYFDAGHLEPGLFMLAMRDPTPPKPTGAVNAAAASPGAANAAAPPLPTIKMSDAILLSVWWRGTGSPRAFEIDALNSEDMIKQVLKSWDYECAPGKSFEKPAGDSKS